MPLIEIPPATRIFYLAQTANGRVEYADKLLSRHRNAVKALTLDNYVKAIEDLEKASAELDVAVGRWKIIRTVINDHPDGNTLGMASLLNGVRSASRKWSPGQGGLKGHPSFLGPPL